MNDLGFLAAKLHHICAETQNNQETQWRLLQLKRDNSFTTVNVRGLSSDAETFYSRSSLGDHLKFLRTSDYMALDFLT